MKLKLTIVPLLLLTLQTQAQAQKLSLVFIGNSITQGKGGTNGQPPPTHTVNFLKGKKGIEDVSFVNVGKSGSTTLDWLPLSEKWYGLATKAADSLFLQKDHQLIFP